MHRKPSIRRAVEFNRAVFLFECGGAGTERNAHHLSVWFFVSLFVFVLSSPFTLRLNTQGWNCIGASLLLFAVGVFANNYNAILLVKRTSSKYTTRTAKLRPQNAFPTHIVPIELRTDLCFVEGRNVVLCNRCVNIDVCVVFV